MDPYKKVKKVNDRTRELLGLLNSHSERYLAENVSITRNLYRNSDPAHRKALRTSIDHCIKELRQQITSMNFMELKLFHNLMTDLMKDKSVKMSSIHSGWAATNDELNKERDDRTRNVKAFFLMDTKSKEKPLATLSTIEAVLDHMLRLCNNSQIELLDAMRFNRFFLIAGRRIHLDYDLKEVKMEVIVDL